MHPVILAAGEGRRLRPITERWAKPVLPIDGRPVIATLVRELRAAGFAHATVVVGHLRQQVERLLGDGSAFGVELTYAVQPDPLGSADAIRCAVDAGSTPPLLVTAADTVYTRGDVGRFVAAWARTGTAGALAVRRDPPPNPPHRYAVRIRDGRIERMKDDDPANPLASAPLWAVGPELLPFLENVPGPPFEAAEGYQVAIDRGYAVAGIEIGSTRDLTDPLDLAEENVPYLRGL